MKKISRTSSNSSSSSVVVVVNLPVVVAAQLGGGLMQRFAENSFSENNYHGQWFLLME